MRKRVAALVVAMTCLLTACFQNQGNLSRNEPREEGELKRKIVLGFAQVGAESDWRKANSASIKAAADEAGIQLMFIDAQQKPEKQINAIRSFIAHRVDVIAFSPIVETGWEMVLKEAKDAGIPVILTDRTIDKKDESLYEALIGSDFREEGRRAGRWLLEKTKEERGEINVVELQGTVGSAPAIDRKAGFEEIIQGHSNIKIIRSESGDFMRSKGYEVMESILKKENRKIHVVYSHNDDMALGAVKAIEEAGLKPGKEILIVSIDGIKDIFEAMIKGKVNCTVECNPLLGPELMKAVKALATDGVIQKKIIMQESVFSEETAAKEIVHRKY